MYNINDIIKDNERLIFSIIKDYGKYYDKEDLYQVSIIGLIAANKNYNDAFGVKFSTYAYKYILGEIKKYVRETSGIKINNEINGLLKKINKAKSLLCQVLMKEPSIKEISNYLDIDINLVSQALLSENKIISLEANCNNEDNTNLYDIIPSKEKYDFIENINLNNELDDLEEPYRSILKYRYYKDKSQSEVAKILGITQVNVSRYETKVLKKLKCTLSA